MDRKLLINLCILALLICFTAYTAVSLEAPELSEAKMEELDYDEVLIDQEKEQRLERTRLLRLTPLVVVSVLYAAFVFIVFILPSIVHRATHQIYDSGEMVEKDPLHDARALFAQGDYDGAIEIYRQVGVKNEGDRFPWVEIAKIQNEKLHDPDAAIDTLREALEKLGWDINDAAFMMFRLAELYEQEKENKEMTADILRQIVEMFPETRHSANATHRLRELGAI